ncbi:hypothetical protein HF1_04220 [Mycoplasma haemofelis str. Langford 1]|uniref:Uncharacterized protein n=1 Tax=Mycoplasma haemofelis (strain Langford 1) TaxID=941640 RepID=E8ZH09_MYCHL|nr:hypothetical protein HF1_04220 [Mycoplasma haemofelis str. Langford 1]
MHYLSSENEIKNFSDKIHKERFTLISKDEEWSSMLSEYKEKTKGIRGAWFATDGKEVTLEELRSACEKAAKEEIANSMDYDEFRRWCTVPKTILSHLSDHGLTALKLNSDNEGDKDSWNKLQEAYLKRDDNIIYGLLEKLKKNENGTEKWKVFQEACEGLSKVKSTDAEFNFSFKDFQSWCTKQGVDKLGK